MIEDTEAVENIDQILTVPGADVFHVASGDLGQSMGNPPPEDVRNLMRQVIPKIRAAGKNVGVGGNSPSDAAGVAEFIKLGAEVAVEEGAGAGAAASREGMFAKLRVAGYSKPLGLAGEAPNSGLSATSAASFAASCIVR